MRRFAHHLLHSGACVVIAGGLVACGSSRVGALGGPELDAGSDGGGDLPPSFQPDPPCTTLECKQVQCGGGLTTTLSGKVYDPAGANPLYNVIVFVPRTTGELPPFKDALTSGISCEPCSGIVLDPLAATLTDTNGEFKLENVPVDADVPVVIQIGKWRRKLHVNVSKKCENNVVPDKTLKLPAKSSEGDMPQIAVTAGGADALECLLRGIGIDDDEFVKGHNPGGHVHVFNGSGGYVSGAPPASNLWNDANDLKKYDLTLLSCEGSEHLEGKNGVSALPAYLDAGGRVFATHYQYIWFSQSPSTEVHDVAAFTSSAGASEYGLHTVNMSFPKGEAFGKWLAGVGSSPLGTINLIDIRDSIVHVNPPATPWITARSGRPRYFSFNTPVATSPDKQCGRGVFSDIHMTPGEIAGTCSILPGGLNEQQKALEFFLFDLSACISDDKDPPAVPK